MVAVAAATTPRDQIVVDGNEAAARIAFALSEVMAIYPITPASAMGELADAWAHQGKTNIWGAVPEVVEMQSEAGAAGALHGAIQTGALGSTFTASQGLLLMLPNLYKIAGELTPAVVHVAARTIATHALSIFGDHSDVMAARQTGMALLCSSSVQEAQDLALVSHVATLESRIPFLHFFDGFRTSHEVATIDAIREDVIRAMVDDRLVSAHRMRSLDPNRPVLRGTAQNPDVFFQSREAANSFTDATPAIVASVMDRLAEHTGRRYRLFDYHGVADAERVLVVMGSAAGAATEAVDHLTSRGEKVGVIVVRLYRPFAGDAFLAALPETARSIAVLDRTKEPGAVGDPLYLDVVAALSEHGRRDVEAIGVRYGLSSKEFTPAHALTVLEELAKPAPIRHATVGITDDVTKRSLPVTAEWREPDDVFRGLFFGLGSDGTVGANKSTAKIVGARGGGHAQGYFVYDSKKSGAMTVSHLRFSPRPITSTYLVDEADFVACHNFGILEKIDVLEHAAPGATFLLNSPFEASAVWSRIPRETQHHIVDKKLRFFVIDADEVATTAGLGKRVNTVLQTCFFALTDLVPGSEATGAIKASIEKAYGRFGDVVLERNFAAVDAAIDAMQEVPVPAEATTALHIRAAVPEDVPDFVAKVTGVILAGRGDDLPVSAFPVDGTFPTATSRFEKRSIATEIPMWDPEICIDCGRCALVCPHAAIRMKVYDPSAIEDAPDGFQSKLWKSKDFAGMAMTIQVAPDDCTGCGVCVDICPARSKEVAAHKAIDMAPKDPTLAVTRRSFDYFLEIAPHDRTTLDVASIKGSQLLEPLFEFSGACAGCGETPYLKLLSQLYGDRAVVANATGCSSIYGGNLPTTPWAVDGEGRGPAWSNSLFEDNAEFGLGMRLAIDERTQAAQHLVEALADRIGDIAAELLDADQTSEAGIAEQRRRVGALRECLAGIDDGRARTLEQIADSLVSTSVWIVGGDGWAYDIGFGGLDHVLASGRDVNILVLDTEVYSNTGGQASKATPRAAVAKFASAGKATGKKDLGMIAQAYGNVYVAQVAMGANMTQVVKAFTEAESYPGPSLIIAFSPCIAHGLEMSTMMQHQKAAAECGYWPLYRYDPRAEAAGDPGLRLDSRKSAMRFAEYAASEARFAMLARSNPHHAEHLMERAQQDIDDRWQLYEQMVDIHRTAVYAEAEE
jgi:pyruvate-ferredoxin/flavodoxin oxidoreductase